MKVSVWGRGRSSLLLARALAIKRNRRYPDIIVRYGVRHEDPIGYPTFELNTWDAIRKASDKLKSLKLMQNAGLTVPPYAERLEDLEVNEGDIIFGRFRYHTQGADIVAMQKTCNTQKYFLPMTDEAVAPEQFLTKEYFLKWVQARAEYRYHVAFGKVILCTKKMLTEDITTNGLVRNHQSGVWRQVTCIETPRFSEACIKAVQAHGLDFGAVDFLNVNRQPMILEVNTAPGLNVRNRLEVYANAIREKISRLL